MKPTESRSIRMYCRFCQRDAGPVPVSGGDALLGLLFRRWPANAGKSCPAILAASRRKGRLDAMGLHNPPSMALPCCPPFAQGGLFLAQANTTGLARERSMGPASRWSGGRTAILSLPFFIQPAWRGSAVRLPDVYKRQTQAHSASQASESFGRPGTGPSRWGHDKFLDSHIAGSNGVFGEHNHHLALLIEIEGLVRLNGLEGEILSLIHIL